MLEGYYFKIKEKWKIAYPLEYFSEKDIQNQDQSSCLFSETALSIRSQQGYAIDLSWIGNTNNKKLFGYITKNSDWDHPIDKTEIKSFNDAIQWIKTWIEKIEDIEDKA